MHRKGRGQPRENQRSWQIKARNKTTHTWSAHFFESFREIHHVLALEIVQEQRTNSPVITVRVGAATVAIVGITGRGKVNLCENGRETRGPAERATARDEKMVSTVA